MIGGRRVLALITARGGSKGLPGKNIRPVAGRPLLAWTIEAAKNAKAPDRLVLSSDDEAIMAVAREWGCEVPFRRPDALATDEASSIDVALHALDALPGFDYVLLLQPTSPLRTAADIDAACALLERSSAPSCVSVTLAEQSPYWMVRLDDEQRMSPVLALPPGITRRQDLPQVYVLNGAIYVANCAWLRQQRSFVGEGTVGYAMTADRALDIDTLRDAFEAERLLVSRGPASDLPIHPVGLVSESDTGAE